MVIIHDVLMYDTWNWTRAALLADARAYFVAQGIDEWDLDNAMMYATTQRAVWSDSYNGFVHNCEGHTPEETDPALCFPDARKVSLVGNLPPVWLGIPPV